MWVSGVCKINMRNAAASTGCFTPHVDMFFYKTWMCQIWSYLNPWFTQFWPNDQDLIVLCGQRAYELEGSLEKLEEEVKEEERMVEQLEKEEAALEVRQHILQL